MGMAVANASVMSSYKYGPPITVNAVCAKTTLKTKTANNQEAIEKHIQSFKSQLKVFEGKYD